MRFPTCFVARLLVVASATVLPVPGAVGAADADCGLPNFEADALRLVNARRAAGASCGSPGRFGPAPALGWHEALASAALGHSREMARRHHFEHESVDGRTPAARVSAAGYDWRSVGENIGVGYGSVQAVVEGWMASEGHCVNLMTASFVHMGLACVRASGAAFDTYWTLDLATPGR